ncbi:MAG: FmdB family zinc ribbon protein [Actinomycetota bacterium]
MPTYSYRCANCDYAFDQYQSFTDDSLTVCPNCGEPQLRKVFNSIGVTFNGSGFYHNDSGSGSSAPAAAPKTEKAAKPEKKAEPKKADSGSAAS